MLDPKVPACTHLAEYSPWPGISSPRDFLQGYRRRWELTDGLFNLGCLRPSPQERSACCTDLLRWYRLSDYKVGVTLPVISV